MVKLLVKKFDNEEIRRKDDDDDAVQVSVSTLDLSVDMLKRELLKDPFAMKSLGIISAESSHSLGDSILGTPSRFFSVGIVNDKGKFAPFDYTCSLKDAGIRANGTIWINLKR